MIPTERFVTLLVLGALMIGFSGWLRPLVLVGSVTASLAVVLLIADWLRLIRAVRLEITRTCEDKLSLGAPNPVDIRLRNSSYSRLTGTLRDEYPEGFEADGGVMPLDLPPRSETELRYHVTPTRRGDHDFGDLYVRLRGPLGMAARQTRYRFARRVKVYPNLLELRRYEVALRRARALQPGQKVVRVYGRGTEFESLRDYVPDDEFRAIDWKATARSGRLTTRQYQQEKSQNVLIVLDCGRVMGPVIDGLTRLDHSVSAGMMLAHVALLRGDKVGLMAFGEDIISYVPPRGGASQMANLLTLTYSLQDAEGDSNYHRAIPYLTSRWTRRSLVVVFTDLVDPRSSRPLISQIASLAKKHLCLCVAMTDPAVEAAGRGPFTEPEDAYRAASARQAIRARKLAAAQLVRLGVSVLDVAPADFTPALVERYLDIKGRALL